MAQIIDVIDSHTAGEPTRVVIGGGPDLGAGPATDRLAIFREHWDHFRSAVVNEPRGSEVLVGALLYPPDDARCVTGVLFFNNVGVLGMCGHGAIGVVETLRFLGRCPAGELRLETPVGVVTATSHADGRVSIGNVRSHRMARDVPVTLHDGRTYRGDVAYGGNYFYLVRDGARPTLELANVEALTELAWAVRQAINQQGYPQVDHVEFFGPGIAGGDARNFVLCPGKAYDRSPCGTGTSAKLACLAADGELAPGEIWRQESILGTIFEGSYTPCPEGEAQAILPRITGRAYITARSQLILDAADPFACGIGAKRG